MNPVVVESFSDRNNKIPISPHGSEGFLGTEDKRPNNVMKDGILALIVQEIPRCLGA